MKTFIKWALIVVIGCFIVLLGFSIYLLIKEPSGANICATVSILLGFLLSLVLEVQQRLINRYSNELLDYLADETEYLSKDYLMFKDMYCRDDTMKSDELRRKMRRILLENRSRIQRAIENELNKQDTLDEQKQ